MFALPAIQAVPPPLLLLPLLPPLSAPVAAVAMASLFQLLQLLSIPNSPEWQQLCMPLKGCMSAVSIYHALFDITTCAVSYAVLDEISTFNSTF
jgi:hypothetical protein